MKKLALLLTLAAPAFAADPALTIYNQGFAVVRDTLPMDLKAGVNNVSFGGATAKLEADSVILRDVAGKAAIQILEQAYRNDPVSEPMLLSFFEGKSLDFIRRETNKPDQTIAGKIIRSGYVPGGAPVQPIIEVEGKLQFSLPGQPIFPSLGDDNILKPTLSWKLNAAAAAKITAEVAYVTQGFSWESSYNLVAPEKGDLVDFVGWITMKNTSGATFANAKIKLMAGNVNKVQPDQPVMEMAEAASVTGGAAPAPVVTEKAFDEFHLYTLARPATLRDKETKQVEFLRASGVKATRLCIYDPIMKDHGWQPGNNVGEDADYGTTSSKKVAVYREFKNSEANHWANETFEIKLRNRKKQPAEIRVVEHLYRWSNWTIKEKSQAFEKTDAQTVEFKVALKPDEEKVVTYKVHYTW